jgi:hypothetical protein
MAVNEIKRADAGTGLSAVGVGKIATLKAYNHIKHTWPNRIEESKLMVDEFTHDYHKFFKRAEQKLNISKEDYIWIARNAALVGNKNSFETWAEQMKWDKIISINPHDWDKFNSRVVKYNFEMNMGHAYGSNGIFDKHTISGYFIKYK